MRSRHLALSAIVAGFLAFPLWASAELTPYAVTVRSEAYRPLPIGGGPVTNHTFSAADDGYLTLSLPFKVRFFDEDKQDLLVNANGWAAWDITTNPSSGWSNKTFPDPAAPNDLMALWWDDNYCSNGLDTQVLGTAPNRTFVMEWRCTRRPSDPGEMQMQLWLYEGSSTIEFRYGENTVQPAGTVTASMGIEDGAASVGYEVPSPRGGYCSPNCTFDDWPTHTVVTFSQGPELRLARVEGPEEAFAGLPMDLSAEVRNVGGKPAEDFTVRFYVSEKSFLDDSAIVLATLDDDVRSLQPREGTTFHASPRLPLHLEEGEYFILAEADPYGAVPEANLSDNVTAFGPFRIGVRAANLLTEWVDVPDLVAPGDLISVRWKAVNSGNLAGVQIPYAIGISASGGSSTAWPRLATGVIERMEMNHEEIRVHELRIPDDIPAGTYHVFVEMNHTRAVFEHEYLDNFAVSNPMLISDDELVVLNEELPVAQFHASYSVRLFAAGGDGTYHWELAQDSILPPGLSLVEEAGDNGLPATFLRGVPSRVGEFEFTLNVRSAGLVASRTFVLEVLPADFGLYITTTNLANAAFGFAYFDELTAIGGVPPYTWEVRGDLPLGLFLRSDGVLSGRPMRDGTYTNVFRVRDSEGREATKELTLYVSAPSALTCVTQGLPPLQLGERTEVELVAAGGEKAADGTYLWTSSSTTRLATEIGEESETWQGSPPGFSLAPNGVVQVNPTEFGTYVWRVQVQGRTGGQRVECPIRIEVPRDHGLTVISSRLPTAIAGRSYRAPLDAAGGEGTLRWAEYGNGRVLEELGLRFDNSGALVGTPSLAVLDGEERRDFMVTVRVQDERNRIGLGVLTLTVTSGEKARGPAASGDGGGCQTGSGSPTLWGLALLGLALLRRPRG